MALLDTTCATRNNPARSLRDHPVSTPRVEDAAPATGPSFTWARRAAFGAYAGAVFAALGTTVARGAVAGEWKAASGLELGFWLLLCAGSNLLRVPVTFNVKVTMSGPINIAIAYLFPPPIAAALVAVGSVNDWEIRGETTVVRAAFNRSQIALASAASSAVLWLRESRELPEWALVLTGIFVYHTANLLLVALAEWLSRGVPVLRFLGQTLSPLPGFVAGYLALGLLGISLALAFQAIGWWITPLVIPLLSAEYGLYHSKQAERERRVLTDRLVAERERERTRIASDMHDVVLQELAAVQLQSDNIGSAIDAGQLGQAKELAGKVKAEIADSISNLRGAIADLRRSGLEENSLPKTLERYAQSFRAETSIEVAVGVDCAAGEVPLPVALLLYECCQEALTNVARHSGATRVELRLARIGGSLELRVRDDGRGPGEAGDGRPRLGLALMRDRVALVGGGVWLEPTREGGAELIVRIPTRGVG